MADELHHQFVHVLIKTPTANITLSSERVSFEEAASQLGTLRQAIGQGVTVNLPWLCCAGGSIVLAAWTTSD